MLPLYVIDGFSRQFSSCKTKEIKDITYRFLSFKFEREREKGERETRFGSLFQNNEQKRLNYNSYLLVKNKIQVEGALTWSLLLHIFFSSRRWKREQQKSKEKYAETHFYDWTCHRFLMQKHQSAVKQMAIHIISNIEPEKEPLLRSWGKDAHKTKKRSFSGCWRSPYSHQSENSQNWR